MQVAVRTVSLLSLLYPWEGRPNFRLEKEEGDPKNQMTDQLPSRTTRKGTEEMKKQFSVREEIKTKLDMQRESRQLFRGCLVLSPG